MINSRRKGAHGERDAAAAWNEIFGTSLRRSQQFKGTETSADIEGVPGLHIEVKRVQNLCVPKALARCAEESAVCNVPVLMHRRNGEPWAVTVYLSDLPRLVGVLTSKDGA